MNKLKLLRSISWIVDGPNNRRVKWIDGISNSDSREPRVSIDASCAKTIYLLNLNGFKTQYHCSGAKSDHIFWDTQFTTFPKNLDLETKNALLEANNDFRGYICFDSVYKEILNFVPSGFDYEEIPKWKAPGNRSVIRIPKEFSEKKKIALWRNFNKILKNYNCL